MSAAFRPVDPAVVRRAAAEAERSAFKSALDGALRTLAAAALSAALSLGAWQAWRWASAAPMFTVREIRFTGLVHATEGELLDLFKTAGNVVKCELIVDKFTSKSRGFAFVTMGTAQESSKAIAEMNGATLDGRALRVNEAEERQSRGGGGGGGVGKRERW